MQRLLCVLFVIAAFAMDRACMAKDENCNRNEESCPDKMKCFETSEGHKCFNIYKSKFSDNFRYFGYFDKCSTARITNKCKDCCMEFMKTIPDEGNDKFGIYWKDKGGCECEFSPREQW